MLTTTTTVAHTLALTITGGSLITLILWIVGLALVLAIAHYILRQVGVAAVWYIVLNVAAAVVLLLLVIIFFFGGGGVVLTR